MKINLPESALNYIHKIIERPPSDNYNILISNISEIYTLMPLAFREDILESYESGGIILTDYPKRPDKSSAWMEPVPDTDLLVAQDIQSVSVATGATHLLLLNAYYSPSDPQVIDDDNYLCFGEKVFLYINNLLDTEYIAYYLNDVSSLWCDLAILSDVPPPATGSDLARLQHFVERAAWFAVGAYDGEGYVMARRTLTSRTQP